MKKVLGFDIDGVLYPWQIACYEHLMLFYNYTGTYEELWGENDFSEFITRRGELFIENLIRIQHLYSAFPPLNRDLESMWNLSKTYDIIYITSRPEDVEFVTTNFFRKYNYPNYNNIIFSTNKIRDVRLYNCDFFVEDRPNYCLRLQNLTNLIMRTQPWNIAIRNKIENKIACLQDLERILL